MTLVIMGIVQATIGTLRLFNQTEEKFESLAPKSTYSLAPDENDISYFSSTTNGQKEKNVLKYFSDNRDIIQNALKTMSTEKAEETVKKIEVIRQITETQTPVVQNNPVTEDAPAPMEPEVFTSPVNVQITPKNTAAPAGYTSMIHTVTE